MSATDRSGGDRTDPRGGAADADDSLPARFERRARDHRARSALGSGAWKPTYADLDDAANRLAAQVLARGGAPGDRVALLMRHDGPLVAAALAALKAGRTVLVLNPNDPPERLRQLLEDAEPGLVVTDRPHLELATRMAGEARGLLCVEPPGAGGPAPRPDVRVSPDDVAFLVYTSGSAGRPKGVMQTHRGILHNTGRLTRGLGLRADDRIVLLASLSGGQGVATTWCALLNGAALCPFPVMEQGISGLAEWLVAEEITVYVSAASVFRHFVKTLPAGARFPRVRLVRLASEPATSEDFAAYRRHFEDGCELFNTLSSSETGNITQWRATRDDAVPDGRLPVGRPVEGVEVLLLDEDGREVAGGEPGEIAVRSRFLSPGYWRNPVLTAERFGGPPRPGEARLFRSGDLARRTAGGLLEFVGRRDDRVRIRGHGVEPSEVEAALLRLPDVEGAAACARPQPSGTTQLVAFVTLRAGRASSAPALRRELARALPSHMLPARLTILESLPLTPHGKVDREALRRMDPGAPDGAPGPGPVTETEAVVAGAWREVLECDGIGRHDDFFDLGGDSLTAAVMAAVIHARLGVELDLRMLVDHSSVSALAAAIEDRRRAAGPATSPRLAPASREAPLPLSLAQERTWRYSRTPDGAAGYTVAKLCRIRGPLDVAALRESIDLIARRHEILRTTFAEVAGRPVQVVHPPSPASLPLDELPEAPDPEERVMRLFGERARQRLDLARGPLVRFWLVRTRPDEHWLMRVAHNLVWDGWSWMVYSRELRLLYEAIARRERPPLPDSEPLQYGDFAAWQRRVLSPGQARHRDALAWWTNALSGESPPPEPPWRRPAPLDHVDPTEGQVRSTLDPEAAARLARVGRAAGATYYVVRLAALVAVLAAETGQPEVVLGTYVDTRSRVELQAMLGPFTNLVALRFRCDPGCSFRGWLSRVRRVVADAQARAEIPYEEVCAALRGRGAGPPAIRVIFAVNPYPRMARLGEATLTWMERRPERMPWGVSLTFHQDGERHRVRAEFDARSYEPAGMRDVVGRLQRFLEAASREPDRSLARLLSGDRAPST